MTDAASIRVHNVGKILKSQGHEVDYICQEGTVPGDKLTADGSTFFGVFDEKSGKTSMAREWIFGSKAVKLLKQLLKTKHYDGVILYNAPITTAKKVFDLCRKHDTAVFNDVTEWYETKFTKGLFSFVYTTLVDRRIRTLDKRSDGIIAISPYLENYYIEKVPVFNIPPFFNEAANPNQSKNALPKFLYAGSPSKKDELFNFIEAMKEINAEKIKAELTVIGAPIPENIKDFEAKGIYFLKRQPRETVLSALVNHDFSLLFRYGARYAKAGYSTKVAEALFYGTPVFCNEIGGADIDIETGFNGIKVPSADKETLKKAISDIIKLPTEKISEMKTNAFNFGQKKYSAISYKKSLSEFIVARIQERNGKQ